jgi:hypothetical protein
LYGKAVLDGIAGFMGIDLGGFGSFAMATQTDTDQMDSE